MSTEPKKTGMCAYAVGVIGALLIAFFLVDSMRKYTAPGGIDQKRAEERRKNLQEPRWLSPRAPLSLS